MDARALLVMGAAVMAVGLGMSRAAPVFTGPDGGVSYGGSRGLRNNNPGNIRDTGDTWVGEVGADSGGYVIFDTPEHGLRALAILLRNYQRLHGVNTLRDLVARYAPSADNNNESDYVADLSQRLGIGPDEPFWVEAVLVPLMQAIIRHENGSQPYNVAMIESAVAMA